MAIRISFKAQLAEANATIMRLQQAHSEAIEANRNLTKTLQQIDVDDENGIPRMLQEMEGRMAIRLAAIDANTRQLLGRFDRVRWWQLWRKAM